MTASVGDQDILLSHNMGQDEPVDPMGRPLEINKQMLDKQTDNLPEALGSVPALDSSVKISPEVAKCTAPSSEPPHPPSPDASDLPPARAPSPAPASAPAPISEADSVQSSEPEAFTAPDPLEEKLHAEPEPDCNGLHDQALSAQKTKTSKFKHPSLKLESSLEEHAQTNEEQELPVPKATYNLDLDQLDDSFNPFTSGGSKIQNSPPPFGTSSFPRLEPLDSSLPVCEVSTEAPTEAEMMPSLSEAKPMMLEFGLDEGTVSKPPPRKLGGKKTSSKLTAKKQKPKISEASSKPALEVTESETDSQPVSEPFSQQVTEPVSQSISEPVSDPLPETTLPLSDSSAILNLDDVPLPRTGTHNFDPCQWDDPNFNPFGSNSQMSSSPVLPKGSYSFDQDNFDDSVDPFKPSKSVNNEDSTSSPAQPVKKVKDGSKQKAGQPPGEKKVRQIPKKSKEKTIT